MAAPDTTTGPLRAHVQVFWVPHYDAPWCFPIQTCNYHGCIPLSTWSPIYESLKGATRRSQGADRQAGGQNGGRLRGPRLGLRGFGRTARSARGDVVLPTAPHGQIRLRCVAQPDAAQAALLDRLGIVLPKRMRLSKNDPPLLALSA